MGNIIDLAKKLKQLADKGVGGEKLNAEKMLQSLMKKHKITLEDICGEQLKDFYFSLKTDEYKFFRQIVANVNVNIKKYGEFDKKIMKQYGLKGNYMITCTDCEFLEIKAKYDFYKKVLDDEMNIFYRAFIQRNELYMKSDSNDEFREDTRTTEEKERDYRVAEMTMSIKKADFYKQLGE